jgi:iron(II)-dependent oxidoreductase
MQAVLDRVIERLGSINLDEEERYFHLLVLFHEDMHGEAITYTRQTLAYPPPRIELVSSETAAIVGGGPLQGDVEIPAGTFLLGATPDELFVFDNEKWAHPVEVHPFKIARAAVSNAEFLEFVEDGGYDQQGLWSEAGWEWQETESAKHPVYWQRDSAGLWWHRCYDQLVSLEPYHPVIHINWYEADAYCRWAGRRLPTELEWEVAASATLDGGELGREKRNFPWGNEPPTADRANLDSRALGLIDADALPAGDSAFGCRQMIGNVWEWTSTDFGPYPGFVVDPYKEYSEPWFGDHKVLRGGGWATRSRLIRNSWRNFYTPDRRDVFAGFRTCAK